MATKKRSSSTPRRPTRDEIVARSGASADVLAAAPGRALTFLIGAARDEVAARALEAVGFDDEARAEGAQLIQACMLARKPSAPRSNDAARAVVELDAWDEGGFRLVRSALARTFPALYAKLTDGLAASADGVGAVRGVTTLLERIARLERGGATEKAALAALAKRGITRDERARLEALCRVARGLGKAPSSRGDDDDAARAHLQALADVHAWYVEWADAAHATIRGRRSLITLGLATKRSSKKGAAPPAPADPKSPST